MVILLGAITIAAQDVHFKVMYIEEFDLDVTKKLSSKKVKGEEFMFDFNRSEFTHITPKKKQVYDIVDSSLTGDEEEFFNLLLKSRETKYYYEYTLAHLPNDTPYSDIVVITKTSQKIICHYGEID